MKTPMITFALFFIILSGCNSSKNNQSQQGEDSVQGTLDDTDITEKYWKLITLEGQEVKMEENQEREIFFTLNAENSTVNGFAGCNHFNGNYNLEKGNRLKFSQIATTMKACEDLDLNDHDFLEVFNLTDNYTINGDTLSLNVGRRAPLAVFEAVYFE